MSSIEREELLALVAQFGGEAPLPELCAAVEDVVQGAESGAGLSEILTGELPQEGDAATAQRERAGSDDIRNQLATMELPQKIKYALFGNAVCRALLIREGNKLIPQFVLKNPKLTGKEVEEFAKNPNLSELLLRSIADSKIWMKSAGIRFNIVTNPKTPQDVALKWLRYLQKHELRAIAKSKNIPQLVAVTAKKVLATMEG